MIETTFIGFVTIVFLTMVTARLLDFCDKYEVIGWIVASGLVFLISHLVGLGVMSLFGVVNI
jgi:hypothetical protein